MQKATNFLNRVGKIFNKQTQYLLLIEIAFIVLVVTVALNYIFNYVNTVSSEDSVISSWEYVYTDGSSSNYNGEWNIANSLQPLSTEKTGKYLHLRRDFEASEKDRALVIFTDYSPVKIAFNGKTVYNNHYNDSAFVGNIYNSITLPAASRETAVEISIALPFSANIRTELSAGSRSQPVRYGFWLVSSGVVAVLGVLLLIASVILSFTKIKTRFYFIVSAAVIAYGAFSAVFALSNYSYLLNFPRLHNISIALVNIFILISLIAVALFFKLKSKGFAAFGCGYFLTTLLILIPQSPALLKVLSAAAGAVGIAAAIALAGACEKLLVKRIQYTRTAFLLLCYMAMLISVCALLLLSRSLNIWISCVRLGGLILLSFIMAVAARNASFVRKKDSEDLEIKNHSECVAQLANLIKDLLSAKSEVEVCRIAAVDICNLAECFGRICPNPPKASDFAYGVAVKGAEGYQLIDSKGFDGTDDAIRFDIIEDRYYSSESTYHFAETYFNFILPKNNEPHIIFYFQNIRNGLSLFFIQMMEAVFNCIEISIGQLPENKDSEQKKENSFLDLARNAEFNDGGKTDHLQCVADYTKIILKTMNYPAHICEVVSNAAMLHDIGKIAIPQGITGKTGLLTETERAIMKKHTEFGFIILSAFEGEFMQAAAVIAKEHHEQYDGSGYGGLKGNEIHEYARVASIADVFDALTTQRSYKEAWSVEAAMDYINSNSGKIFDPRVVSAMNRCLDEIKERYREKTA